MSLKDKIVFHQETLYEAVGDSSLLKDVQEAVKKLKEELGYLEPYQYGYGAEIDNIIKEIFGEWEE